ncbi:MAG TPA: hypothetical protein VEH76_09015 [Methylocystis sp.]|nr:hypothetical protein [Methylocystis sp.]
MQDLSKQFDGAMFDIYRRAKSEAGYNATIFLQMLNERGGLDTAKYLINSSKVSDGYTALYLRNRLDLTVEAMVVEHAKWHELFTGAELAKARERLKEYRYIPKSAGGIA